MVGHRCRASQAGSLKACCRCPVDCLSIYAFRRTLYTLLRHCRSLTALQLRRTQQVCHPRLCGLAVSSCHSWNWGALNRRSSRRDARVLAARLPPSQTDVGRHLQLTCRSHPTGAAMAVSEKLRLHLDLMSQPCRAVAIFCRWRARAVAAALQLPSSAGRNHTAALARTAPCALVRHRLNRLPVEEVAVVIGRGEQRAPEFLAQVNPLGKLPALTAGTLRSRRRRFQRDYGCRRSDRRFKPGSCLGHASCLGMPRPAAHQCSKPCAAGDGFHLSESASIMRYLSDQSEGRIADHWYPSALRFGRDCPPHDAQVSQPGAPLTAAAPPQAARASAPWSTAPATGTWARCVRGPC